MFAGLFMYLNFLILGFAFGAFRSVPNRRKVIGVIESLEQRNKSQRGMISYTAIVSYVVKSKIYYTKTSYQSTSFKRGKKITVYYNLDNPEHSYVRGSIVIYLCMGACATAGTLLIIKDVLLFLS